MGISEDITEKKQLEEKIEEDRYRKIFEAVTDGVLLADIVSKRFFGANKAMCRMLGYSEKEIIKLRVEDIHPHKDLPNILRQFDDLASGKIKIVKNIPVRVRGDGLFYADITSGLITINGKKYNVGIFHDITKIKEARDKLEKSENLFRGVFEQSGVAKSLTSPKGNLLKVNKSFADLLGYSMKEMEKLNFAEITYPDDLAISHESVRCLLAGEKVFFRFEKRYFHKNGNIVWTDLSTTLLRDDKGQPLYFATSIVDISEKKKVEFKLMESRNQLEEAEEIANLGSYILNIQKDIWKSSKKLDAIFGIDEKYTRSLKGWLNIVHPDYKKEMEDYFIKEVVGKHKLFEKEYMIIRQTDKAVRWVYGLGRLEFAKNGLPIRMIGIIQDITEKREKDLQLSQAKDDFLALVAHQFRTPLSETKWLIEGLLSDHNFDSRQNKKLYDIMISNERLIKLVKDFLDVAKIDSASLAVNRRNTNLAELITNLVDSQSAIIKNKNKVIKVILSPNLKSIHCDRQLISEALKNILNNAICYSDENYQTITISVGEQVDGYIVAVNNQGTIDDFTLKLISNFEKFTRGNGAVDKQPAGSGLGLYIAKKAIEANGGSVWFESNAEHGTTFYVKIIGNKGK